MKPFYEDESCVIYHGNALDLRELWMTADVLVSDPPYGIDYKSGMASPGGIARSIAGDKDTSLRDTVLGLWGADKPALIFGTWRVPRPALTRQLLIWDTKGALGMGDLSLPWKPSHQEIYVLGSGFIGKRTTDVLSYAPVQSMAKNGRVHPHEKPVDLMRYLIGKCPDGVVVDPFMGSGTTLRAAKDLGRKSIGIEVDERYCELAVQRLAQETLFGPQSDDDLAQ